MTLVGLIISYLIGAISGSYILGKVFLKKDVRLFGSGNAGTTNAMRAFGKKWGILTFIIDFLKGIICVLILEKIFNFEGYILLLGILICILGHDFPFYMKFKGGKGVATTIGSFLMLNFNLTFICVLVWAISTIVTKMVSLGSILFFVSLSVIFICFYYTNISAILVFLISLLGIFQHRSNIYRIINKTENKIGAKK